MSRRTVVSLVLVLSVAGLTYGVSVMLLSNARRALAQSGCEGAEHPPGEAVWLAMDRLETLARLPWLSRAANDHRVHELWVCRGAVETVCAEARWDAERRARQAIRDERDRRTAEIRHESDRRRRAAEADTTAIVAWERAEQAALDAWEREAERAPEWRPHVAPDMASTCETWAPTIAELARRSFETSCAVCE